MLSGKVSPNSQLQYVLLCTSGVANRHRGVPVRYQLSDGRQVVGDRYPPHDFQRKMRIQNLMTMLQTEAHPQTVPDWSVDFSPKWLGITVPESVFSCFPKNQTSSAAMSCYQLLFRAKQQISTHQFVAKSLHFRAKPQGVL